MAAKLIEVTGTFLGERFRRDDFVIGTVRLTGGAPVPGLEELAGPLSVLGEAEPGSLKQRFEYRFYGRIERDHQHADRFGPQFRFQTFVPALSHSRESVCRYLQQCPHVGPATASSLWDKFSADAVRILRETPDVAAAAVPSLASRPAGSGGATRADEAAAELRKLHTLEGVTIEMLDLLGGQGFPRNTVDKCIRLFGNLAPQLIRRNPYLLMHFRGIGFAKADSLYLSLGLPPERLKRQALCAWYALASNTEGHTWLPRSTAVQGIAAKVGGAYVKPDKAIRLAVRARLIAMRRDKDGNWWATEYRKAKDEQAVLRLVLEAMDQEPPWHQITGKRPFADAMSGLTRHQQLRLRSALSGTIGILGGTPGTGKTYSAAALLRAIVDTCGADSVAVAAPTGKAAVKLTEYTKRQNLPLRAVTIESLLGVKSHDEAGGWTFRHNRANKLPHKWLIIDESSMIDVPRMRSLLAARDHHAGLLLIGDVNQLPPVGHGAPLRDLIAGGVPYAELTEVQRNAGSIVRACAAIRSGGMFCVNPVGNLDTDADDPRNLAMLPAATPQQSVQQLLAALKLVEERFRYDPVWQCQIIVAVNKRSPLCRVKLNEMLQERLNPGGQQTEGSPYRIGDKCIVLKNQFLRSARQCEDPASTPQPEETFVANGEFNRVVAVEARRLTIKLDAPERLLAMPDVLRGQGNEENSEAGDGNGGDSSGFDLGYAVTCHKMQGSSAAAVIVILDDYPGASGKYGICGREWLYTAISRAEKLCLLIGKPSTARAMIHKVAIGNRKTFLGDDIKAERLWSGRAWWQDTSAT